MVYYSNQLSRGLVLVCLGVVLIAGQVARGEAATTRPAQRGNLDASVDNTPGTWILHLPGIGGYMWCDRRMIEGLKQGGVAAQFKVYDWTEEDPGLDALHASKRNMKEAAKIAEMIIARHQADPNDRICITAHSGGCGLAVWALAKLPADVMVDTVILAAPALSPKFDLSDALRHVRGKMYAFTSTNDDLVLEVGTQLFGTMDGEKCAAAGFGGFVRPDKGDAEGYKKLVGEPYDPAWEKYDNSGSHIGAMSRDFAAAVWAPLLDGKGIATTQPSLR